LPLDIFAVVKSLGNPEQRPSQLLEKKEV